MKDDEFDSVDITRLRVVNPKSSAKSPPALPPGKLNMVVTYLQMLAPPPRESYSKRGENIAILRAHPPTVSFYRYLYNSVGEKWMWYERRQMEDEILSTVIEHEKVEVYVLYVDGNPAGFAELDLRKNPEVELAYFGLIPDFIGRGLGSYLLRWAVDKAWSHDPSRVWLHTCNHDHPRALAVYQKYGFQPFRQESHIIDDPRLNLRLLDSVN